jgi:hypothetical protein
MGQIREWLGQVRGLRRLRELVSSCQDGPARCHHSNDIRNSFGLALFAGFQIRNAALGSAGLLTLFALAMFSGDPKSPFDYSVFSAAFWGVHASGLHYSNGKFRVRYQALRC